jgi:hypothetical protein
MVGAWENLLMRLIKLTLLVIFGCALLPSLPAQVMLQAKLPEKFYVELKSESKRSTKTAKGELKDRIESTELLGVTILKTNPDGSMVAELKVESFKEAAIDEAGKRKESDHPELQDEVVQLTLDANMNITKVDGIQKLIAKFDPNRKASMASKQNSAEYYENGFRFWAGQIFVPLSGKAVNTGDKWEQKSIRRLSPYGSLRLTKTLVYSGSEKVDGQELHKLTFTTAHTYLLPKTPDAIPFQVLRPSVNKGIYEGTIYFDPVAGHIVRADCKDLREITMTISTDARDSDIRIRDEGTSSMRFLEKKPAP